MATTVAVAALLLRDEYMDVADLSATNANNADDLIMNVSLPAGFGDVLLLEVQVLYANLTGALVADAALVYSGAEVEIGRAVDGAAVAAVGASRFVRSSAGSVAATFRFAADIKPDQAVLWRQQELMVVRSPFLEAATSTGDVTAYARVRRLRNLGLKS